MVKRTPQGEVFFPLLLSSKVAGVPKDSQFPLFGSVSHILTLASNWGCDRNLLNVSLGLGILILNPIGEKNYSQFSLVHKG
jgi:hypothetical protein